MVSLPFLVLLSIIPCILAAQVHPVARAISSGANCTDGYEWMNNAQGKSPCLTVAYVEGACIGNNYVQPALTVGYSYTLPNSSSDDINACYCSWSSYNLMMACTLCQGPNFFNSTWTWPTWSNGCTTNSSWTDEYFPPGRVLAGNASIPYWATLNPANWSYQTFNIQEANNVYDQDPSNVVPGASSTPSSTSGSSSKSTDVGAIVGGTVGAAAVLALLAVGAYMLYKRHMYKKGEYASVANQRRAGFIDTGRVDGTTSRMTHNRFGSDTSTQFAPGHSLSPSQQYNVYSSQPQTAYPSIQGSFSPPPRTDTSIYTTHGGQTSNAIPLV